MPPSLVGSSPLHRRNAKYFSSHLKRRQAGTAAGRNRRTLGELDTKMRGLIQLVDTHEERLSQPRIHSIPGEVLQEIFLHCLPSNHLPILSPSEAPILLTQICGRWRSLALSWSRLWTAVHIPIPASRYEGSLFLAFDNRLAGVRWWFAHALQSPHPLTVSLYWPESLEYTFGRRETFVRAVISASYNIRELDLCLPDHNLKIILNKPTTLFPRLEKITLRRGSDIEDACLWEAPALRKVVWDGVCGDIARTPLKWGALEEVRVEGTSQNSWLNYEDAMALLKAMRRNLVTLGIQLSDTGLQISPGRYGSTLIRAIHGAGLTDGRLSLPQLETLDMVVEIRRPHFLPKFYESIQLPSLRTLSYANRSVIPCPHSQFGPHPVLTLLSIQTQPIVITTLTMDAQSISRATFLKCLKLMPSLERLWVKDTRPSEVEGSTVEDSLSTGDIDREIVPDDGLLGHLLPTFPHQDVPVALSWDFELLSPFLTHIRFDRAQVSLVGLKNFVQTRLALSAAHSMPSKDEDPDEASKAIYVAKLKNVYVVLGYETVGRSNEWEDFRYELQESDVSVTASFAQRRTIAAKPPLPARGVFTNPRDGLRELDNWF